jgi:hypothetical protein
MRKHKITTKPLHLEDLRFEEFFEELYSKKIRYEGQKTAIRPHLREWTNHAGRLHHA